MQHTIGGVLVSCDGRTVSWTSGMEVDVDGAPNAYSPDDTGIDALANAGHPGNFYGVVTDTGEKTGTPIMQLATDPFPGFYVSQGSFGDAAYPESDPRHWIDATKVPYVSVPPDLIALGVRKGDLAIVRCGTSRVGALVGDGSPRGHLGEGSFALHMALGFNPQRALPKHRLVGISGGVWFEIHLGTASSPPWPRPTLAADLAALLSS